MKKSIDSLVFCGILSLSAIPIKTMKDELTEFAKIIDDGESSTKMLAYAFLTAIAAFVVGSILLIAFFLYKAQ
jgi:hypothetical protein